MTSNTSCTNITPSLLLPYLNITECGVYKAIYNREYVFCCSFLSIAEVQNHLFSFKLYNKFQQFKGTQA
jgi:hypothetical protein